MDPQDGYERQSRQGPQGEDAWQAWQEPQGGSARPRRTGFVPPQSRPRPPGPRLDAARLWAGGAVTALVAALTAVVGLLLIRGVLGIPVFAPEGDGAMGDASTGVLAVGAAFSALLATGVLHLLILATPRPGTFFGWLVALATAVMVLLPFTTSAPLDARIGSAALYLVIGIAIGSLLSAAGRGAMRREF
ncbi:DUF6069 family protein [Streptomyces sp. NPDC057682]|uniref:DUF6069 family protein n=1 Tax=unclassified Streptomyces TaxID=2593676 RepID=UPI00365E9854